MKLAIVGFLKYAVVIVTIVLSIVAGGIFAQVAVRPTPATIPVPAMQPRAEFPSDVPPTRSAASRAEPAKVAYSDGPGATDDRLSNSPSANWTQPPGYWASNPQPFNQPSAPDTFPSNPAQVASGAPNLFPNTANSNRYESVPGQMFGGQNAPSAVMGGYGGMLPQDRQSIEISQLIVEIKSVPANHPVNSEKIVRLRTLVSEQFEARHSVQKSRLDQVKANVQRAQEILDRRHNQRDEIINRRVSELLGQADPLQWDYQATPQMVNGLSALPSIGEWNPGNPPDVLSGLVPAYEDRNVLATETTRSTNGGLQNLDPLSQIEEAPAAQPYDSTNVGTTAPEDLDLQLERELAAPSESPSLPPDLNDRQTELSREDPLLEPTDPAAREPMDGAMLQDTILTTGRRLFALQKGLAQSNELALARGNVNKGEMHASMQAQFDDALEEWQFAHSQLDHQLKREKLAVDDASVALGLAQAELAEGTANLKNGLATQAELRRLEAEQQHAENNLQRAQLEMDRVMELQQWTEKLQQKIDAFAPPAATPPSTAAPATPIESDS